jgi:membrane protein implicated in regulation of membrane protease activity
MPEIAISPAVMWAVVGLLFLMAEVATLSFVLCFIGM